ncbi:MAG: 16S rRNA (uracil(1498)-N(3))-methyltransferase [Pseudomonadales bacterium]|nr:MAG: 16S rRNA (uracil(1498)-N(3))-methyltransferase [Pseudomonadales bacterium]
MNCLLLSKTAINNKKISNPQQVNHIKKVLKSKVGDSLIIGKLGGHLGRAVISEMTDTEILLIDIVLDKQPPAKLDVTVVLALPRPKVMRRLIMDMTALGVNKIILVNSYRTQKSYWQSPLLNRLDEFVLEGLQQAIDTIAPKIEFKKRFKPFVEDEFAELLAESSTSNKQQARAVIAHPYALQSWQDYLNDINKANKTVTLQNTPITVSKIPKAMPKVLCIGAEGGWIDYEVDLLCQQGCTAVSLGERILRTEAVVNVLLGSWLTV